MNGIELALFSSRIQAICDEMGAVLQRAAFSPNIRERLDFSCAIFDTDGRLAAQAAHIPVHLGSMAFAMADILDAIDWQAGDMVVINDPFSGGTHLPDITLIAPIYLDGELIAFAANRAHHADIGAATPGSMPVSKHIAEEGLLLAPTKLLRDGKVDSEVMQTIMRAMSNPAQTEGDFRAQISANRLAIERCHALAASSVEHFRAGLKEQNLYAQRLAQAAMQAIPNGEYRFDDQLDSDGVGGTELIIAVTLTIQNGEALLDFSGTALQAQGNINCPLSVTAAAAFYAFRCLMPANTPACAGAFDAIKLAAPPGCIVNARYPAAVAAGNVETSTRIVDVVLGALAQAIPEKIPAASHGSMNNLALGARETGNSWDYYETIGGGMGAHAQGDGQSARQTHMTNTLNTPIEVLETSYPLQVNEYSVRHGSGGRGAHRGGDGILRDFTVLKDCTATLLTERRDSAPWGSKGGEHGQMGENLLNGRRIDAKQTLKLTAGDRLRIATPGGGGYGEADV